MSKMPLFFLIVLLAVGGCSLGRSPRSSFYMLTSPAETTVPAERFAVTGPRVAVGPVSVPGYLDRPELFLRKGNSTNVELTEFHQWSEPITDGVTRVLCDAISASLAARKGLAFPLRSPLHPQWRISIDITRLDGSLKGEVLLDAGWILADEQGTEVRSGRFVRRAPAGETITTLVQAQSALLAELGATLGRIIPE